MKNLNFNNLKLVAASLLVVVFTITSCEVNDVPTPGQEDALPQQFRVDIPSSISNEFSANARYANGRTAADTLQGNDIYEHLGLFIHIGEEAAEIVEDIINGIRHHHINRPMVLSFEGDDDGRVKNLVVEEDVEFDGEFWEFQLTITDAESETNPDGGKAIQVFWNTGTIKGVALLKPYNIDRENDAEWAETMFRIDYSEGGEHGYEAHMIVSIAELPMVDPLEDPYSMSTMKMFAGRNGDVIDVYGNSDHPNAIFFAGEAGFNWAFVASGSESQDIGVAEVGLPPSNLDEPSRSQLLGYYAIKEVFTREILQVWPGLDPDIVDAYLKNTAAPGYFDTDGFISGGESPGEEFDVLAERLGSLSPYNPKEIRNLTVEFK